MISRTFLLNLALLLMVSIICCPHAMAISGKAKVTIKVVDEHDQPVKAARVGVGFKTEYTSRGTSSISTKGTTDSDGIFVSSESSDGHIGFNVKKDGYYESVGSFDFSKKDLQGWEPWNPELEVVLRKIENPVPMYARDTLRSTIEIPVIGKDVGFDLVVFDWVTPYGNGVNSDFIFNLEKNFTNKHNFKARLVVSFSNKYDGIQEVVEQTRRGSEFVLPRQAVEDGYKSFITLEEWRVPNEQIKRNYNYHEKDINYFFRIRSEEDGEKLVRSMYGKLIGPLRYDPIFSETAKIFFKYYLNPDYTRNLEFDPQRNLFENLPDREKVGIK